MLKRIQVIISLKNIWLVLLLTNLLNGGCNSSQKKGSNGPASDFSSILRNYYEEYLALFPVTATYNGDHRYDDRFPCDISASYVTKQKQFYDKYLNSLGKIDSSKLTEGDKLSFDVLRYDLELNRKGLNFEAFNYMPINQIFSTTLTFPQLGSGESAQPFATPRDYANFLKRIDGFAVWCDTAIENMRTGVRKGYVLPKALVVKMIPQMKGFVVADVKKSVFYGPIKKLPKSFSASQVDTFTRLYSSAIKRKIVPTFSKLATFLINEYLPKSRTSSGFSALPGGKELYNYELSSFTTTSISADSVFNLGLREVAKIRKRIDSVRIVLGYKRNLSDFMASVRINKELTPFHSDKEILDQYQKIYQKERPFLSKYFGKLPKTRFEIRKTEDFRAASAALGEYNSGTPDGQRPGIFYTAIIDPRRYSKLTMETLFLHEAIPGHHFQISLQNENTSLPEFRRYYTNSAYAEGWALYAESLGSLLGQYTDPYELLGNLGDDIHRAIRLVVDAGMHAKGWSREKAIKYMLENEPTSSHEAEAEIERYMAAPGQAVSYKIGALTIADLRDQLKSKWGSKFSISSFHDELLKNGALPLEILKKHMLAWAAHH